MEQSTINQRLKFLVDNLAKTAKDFSAAIEESPTNTSNYTGKRQTEPRAEYLSKVLFHFGNVNARWLMTGEGEAFTSGEPTIIQAQEKNSGNVVGQITGGKNKFTTLADCAKENEHLRAQVALLNRHLDEKERTIQILLNQQPKP